MINPRAIASIGIGPRLGAYAKATLGFIERISYEVSYLGGAGNYHHKKHKKKPLRAIKKIVKEIVLEITPYRTNFYINAIDLQNVSDMIQYENKQAIKQFIRNEIERKLKAEQDEEDFLLLCCF